MQMRPRLRGRWGSASGVTVEEVEEIWTYCGAVDFHRQRSGLVALAETVAEKADQEAIAIVADGGMEIVVGELLNPQVEASGDMAVLSFNFVSWTGKDEHRWNCTEVYRRIEGHWRIVQTHWSLTKK